MWPWADAIRQVGPEQMCENRGELLWGEPGLGTADECGDFLGVRTESEAVDHHAAAAEAAELSLGFLKLLGVAIAQNPEVAVTLGGLFENAFGEIQCRGNVGAAAWCQQAGQFGEHLWSVRSVAGLEDTGLGIEGDDGEWNSEAQAHFTHHHECREARLRLGSAHGTGAVDEQDERRIRVLGQGGALPEFFELARIGLALHGDAQVERMARAMETRAAGACFGSEETQQLRSAGFDERTLFRQRTQVVGERSICG